VLTDAREINWISQHGPIGGKLKSAPSTSSGDLSYRAATHRFFPPILRIFAATICSCSSRPSTSTLSSAWMQKQSAKPNGLPCIWTEGISARVATRRPRSVSASTTLLSCVDRDRVIGSMALSVMNPPKKGGYIVAQCPVAPYVRASLLRLIYPWEEPESGSFGNWAVTASDLEVDPCQRYDSEGQDAAATNLKRRL
jgi:hypothetical protein